MFGIAWGVGSLLVLVGLGEGFEERPAQATGAIWRRRGDGIQRDDSRAGKSAHRNAAL